MWAVVNGNAVMTAHFWWSLRAFADTRAGAGGAAGSTAPVLTAGGAGAATAAAAAAGSHAAGA